MPSVTVWTRLEPMPRDGSMQRSLQSQVRDPAWILARQWMTGEFTGDDAGSPVQAGLSYESRGLTTYRPGPDPGATADLDTGLPLETHVEREAVRLNLWGSVQLGLAFEDFARSGGVPAADLAAIRTDDNFTIGDAPGDELPDLAGRQARALAAGRVPDGQRVYAAIKAGGPALPASVTIAIQQRFTDYVDSLYSQPASDPAWDGRQLRFGFAVGSATPDDDVALVAPDFTGDRLDWYAFEPSPVTVRSPAQTTVTATAVNFLPNLVTFHGMPTRQWWHLEDAQTDFGELDADHVDLAKMLVMEFALVYGSDWFQIPLPADAGSLLRVDSLVVSNTFGEQAVIESADRMAQPGQRPWSVFRLSDGTMAADYLFIPPGLGTSMDGPVLEDVLFLRDEMAAMAWAVEKSLQGPMDTPVDGYEAWRLRLADQPVPPRPPTPDGPEIYYLLQTTVPDNWIAMVPVQAPGGGLFFRRGVVERPAAAGPPVPVLARGVILDPGRPYFVTDQAIPPTGADVTRRFRRARWTDGSTHVWVARQARPGAGPGWAGLAYDLVEKVGEAPEEIEP
jgi:hypothetical protein